MTSLNIATLSQSIGAELGVSDWYAIDQDRISAFAQVTEDHQFIHTDPVRAAATPFGGTIAHGFLPLSLLSVMLLEGLGKIGDITMSLNYGFDKIRFLTPVKSGQRICARFRLDGIEQRSTDQWKLRLGVRIEIEGNAKPALAADWLVLMIGAD